MQKADHTTPLVSETSVSDNDTSDDNIDSHEPNDIVTTHCLTFKVMGTRYSKARQDSLQEAYEYLNEHNRPVHAKLRFSLALKTSSISFFSSFNLSDARLNFIKRW